MSEKKIKISKEKCKGCFYCLEFCPKKSLFKSKDTNAKGYVYVEYVDAEGKCTSCAICALMCPEAAIEVQKEK